MKLPSKSYKNLNSLSPKFPKSKDKLFISIFDDENLKKFINFQLIKKYSTIEKNNLNKSKNSKMNNTIYKSSNSLSNINNNLNTNINIYNTIDYNTLYDYRKKVKSSSKNKIISIKYSVNNEKRKNYMKPLIINKKKKKKNITDLINCKSMKKIDKNKIFFNNKIQLFNLKNLNKFYQSNQNSKTDCSTFERTEYNSHKRNNNNNQNEIKKYNSEYNMNKNQFIQSLIDTYEDLKFEVNKIKREKQDLEKELYNLKNSNKEEDNIIQLQNEIKYYQNISENYKKNCDELTIQIVHLKSEIKKFQI